MIKLFKATAAIFLSLVSFSMSGERKILPEIYIDQMSEMTYQLDSYGNWCPCVDNLEGNELKNRLYHFATIFQKSSETIEKALIIKLPLSQFGKSEAIKEAGCTFHYANDNYMEWKIQHNSPMPDPMTSIAGARVIFYKEGKILAIEDKNLPNRFMLPGGSNDKEELNQNTAIREAREEVGLSFKPEDCYLIGMMNRVKASRYGANDMSLYYLVLHFTGDVVAQEAEITWAGWVDLDEVLAKKGNALSEQKFLKASQVTLDILQHIKDGMRTSQLRILPDLRQAWKPVQDQDPEDVMHLHLLASPSMVVSRL